MTNLVPPSHHESKVLGWANEAVQEATSFLSSQPGFDKIENTIDHIMGESTALGAKPSSLSSVTSNRLGKVALDLAATMTDIKPFWEYRTFNKRFEHQASLGNKLASSWWVNRFIDTKYADAIKFALVAGTGYPHIIYNEETHDLDMLPEDPRDVLPIRPSSYLTLQDCLGVLIRRERTVNYVKAKYPDHAHKIVSDRDASARMIQSQTRYQRLITALGLKRSGFVANLNASLSGRPKAELKVPAVDVNTLYVKDHRRNQRGDVESFTGDPIYMGPWRRDARGEMREETSWSYKVEAGELLYPNKRLIIFTRTAVLYDDTSIYWHGLFPLIKLTLDPWPWTWLGKSPLWDLIPLQESLTRNLRVVDDHNEKVARPDLVGDKNAIPRSAMTRIDTRRSGLKLRTNPSMGKALTLQYPDALDPSIQAMIEFTIKEMEELSGARDASQFTSLAQIPSSETIEKILESMTPAIRMRSRVLEASLREFATITLSNFFQFYTTSQRLAVLGPDGYTFEDADFDPGTLIPDFINDEDYDDAGKVKPDARARGPRSRMNRASAFLRFFTYHIAPGSLLSASEVTRKLLYLQLARAGWIDIWTLGEVLGIPNLGNPPDGAKTIPERLAAMQEMGLGMAVNPAGRKASGQQMPRQTIKESS